jgi:hypothetical protein
MKTKGGMVERAKAKKDKSVPIILAELRAMGSERDRAAMARYGINVDNAYGVSVFELRKVAIITAGDFRTPARKAWLRPKFSANRSEKAQRAVVFHVGRRSSRSEERPNGVVSTGAERTRDPECTKSSELDEVHGGLRSERRLGIPAGCSALEHRSAAKTQAPARIFGRHSRKVYGSSTMRLGTDHELALALWATGNHEARLPISALAANAAGTRRYAPPAGRQMTPCGSVHRIRLGSAWGLKVVAGPSIPTSKRRKRESLGEALTIWQTVAGQSWIDRSRRNAGGAHRLCATR